MYRINIALLGIIVNETRNEFGKKARNEFDKKGQFKGYNKH